MTWQPIEAVAAIRSGAASEVVPGGVSATAAAPGPAGPGFGEMIEAGLGEVNRQLLTSQVDMQRLAVGEVQNLHEVMIRLEESRLSFQLMLQVRNRLLEAYQDVMKMQV